MEGEHMKVAIIGAGPSGMACAHELERHGISPVIFEQRHRPGDPYDHSAAVLQLFTRPYDPVDLLRKKFHLDLQPFERIRKITMKSPRKKVLVKGNLGYFFMRGTSPESVESQLYSKIRAGVTADTRADYLELSGQFDYVVVANGGYDVSRSEGVWSLVIPTNLVGGTVIGDFDPTEMVMWIDTRYSRSSYAYLCPMGKNRAFLGLVVPESTADEARQKWKLFWEMERHPYEQISEVVVEHSAGYVYPHQVGKLLFVGIAGGFKEPFLGFGLMSAVKSGVLAGRAIATGQRYEDLLDQIKKDMEHSLVFRKLLNKADNRDYDRIMAVLSVPGLKQLIYNTNIDVVRIASASVAFLNSISERFKNG